MFRLLGNETGLASDLIEAPQDLEPCTEPQQRFIAMMLRDLGDWIRVGNRPSQPTINTYYKLVDLLEPYFSHESVEHGPLDWSMLSKRQASEIIGAIKSDYEAARPEDDERS